MQVLGLSACRVVIETCRLTKTPTTVESPGNTDTFQLNQIWPNQLLALLRRDIML